ncbi:unnamed protein product [Rhizophagus irregularis]|uniref:Protein kinase domain-containing protein n=1 Tax=Rhizophagus irregularis TaxID=588596 RepID=A0A2N1MD38_9GLOM|nr:hypothetical protein RhiirC2_820729 [Rhizophagus irregularis]CAB4396470.1 unnamed protein product [Rhizophagus irregularis]
MILYANEIVHQNIRWKNVIRLTNNSWVLIDFKEATPIGRGNQSIPILNIVASEYRGMKSDLCRTVGDIWMIGNLLNDLKILQIQLSARARNFWDGLIQQNHDERPSAADAIDEDWFSDM